MSSDGKLEYRSVAGIAVIRNPHGNRITEADDDVHNVTRKSSEKIYLLVKKPRDEHAWQFPQGGLKKKKGETVPQGALRELLEECGQDLKVRLIDETNAATIYQYDFPPEFIKMKKKKKQYKGAKVQFVRAEWLSGQCLPDGKEIIDFAWLTLDEIKKYTSEEYYAGITPLLEMSL